MNDLDNILQRPATEQINALKAGQFSSKDLFNAARDRALKHTEVNAFISMADALTEDLSEDLRSLPLAGLPIAIKDNIDVAGMLSTNGTPGLREYRAEKDAGVIGRLRDAGAQFVGKLNQHELAAGITSNNIAFGPVRNPANLAMIAGGSSGGSAAAVAAGIVSATLGTDTAGSCRIPAALCGVVGFRPSINRYPGDGIFNLSASRDTVGVLARSVPDVAVLDGILANQVSALPQKAISEMRLGVPRAHFYENLDEEIVPIIDNALEQLRAQGATLIETEVADVGAIVAEASIPIICYEFIRDLGLNLNLRKSSFTAWEILEQVAGKFERELLGGELQGAAIPYDQYRHIIEVLLPALAHNYSACFERDQIDALVFPTTPVAARPIGDDDTVLLNGEPVSTLQAYLQNVQGVTLVGLPSISVPVGKTTAGLPVGICFDGRRNDDKALLSIAATFESIVSQQANN